MKFKITKAEFDKLPEGFQAEYTEKDGEYILSVEGGEDTGALKRAKDHEKERRQKAEQKARDLEDQLGEVQTELDEVISNKADNPNLEKKWQEKYDKREKELTDESGELRTEINRLLVDNVAESMARDLSDSPGVILPHLKSRLTVEMVDGKAVTKVKDSDGELSALTLDELKNEFSSNDDFASVIRGSKGSGSGANGGQGGGGGNNTEKPDFTTATPAEKAAYLKSQKESGA